MSIKGFKHTHCKYGHLLEGDNVYIVPKTGKRHCRICLNRYRKNFNENNPTYHKEKMRGYRINDPTHYQIYQKQWHELNPGYRKEYENKRRKEDLNFRIRKNIRSRLNNALKNNYKLGSAINDLGCSIGELKLYLENQFDEDMTWENYGEWHIDHVIPLSHFDLTNRREFLEAFNWLNLQPLWAKDNMSKGSRI